MNFTTLYNDTLDSAREIADELEHFGHADPLQLINERAYSRGIETYFATAFEIVDAMRGDGNLFDAAEHEAGDALYGLQVNFSDWVHQVAYEGYRLLMIEQIERMGVEL
jgi:hypothetical protein